MCPRRGSDALFLPQVGAMGDGVTIPSPRFGARDAALSGVEGFAGCVNEVRLGNGF